MRLAMIVGILFSCVAFGYCTTSFVIQNNQVQIVSTDQTITQSYTADQLASEVDSTQSEIDNFDRVKANWAAARLAYLQQHLTDLHAMQQALAGQ